MPWEEIFPPDFYTIFNEFFPDIINKNRTNEPRNVVKMSKILSKVEKLTYCEKVTPMDIT